MRQTRLKISLSALEHNAREIRAALPGGVKMMPVVKADAYGHGAPEFARRLQALGADWLAVALVEEGIAIREAGVTLPILVLGGADESSYPDAIQNDISLAVYDTEALRGLNRASLRLGKRAGAHLKIDTGMSRVGVFGENALYEMLDAWRECPQVDMQGIFTHFAAADEDMEFTLQQNALFDAAVRRVRDAGYRPIAHAAATTAMMNPELQHDMVRPGIGLYGLLVPELAGKLKLAQTLVTRPCRIETLPEGSTVGYGRTFRANRETRVMTLPIGYGDGYPRLLSRRAEVLVRSQRAPIAGNVCMDMLMVDITDVPGVTLQDEVVLMGSQGDECITPEELSQKAETIPYEIMLGFSARVRRTFEE